MNKNQTSLKILEHNKRCNILFFAGKSVWEGYLGKREDFLTSNYWKNWRERIKNFQSQDEMNFYVDRLSALMSFIYQSVADKGWINNKSDPRIKKEEERLENISEKEWKREDKFADVELREVSAEEALNDPWFNKEIDNIFGRENRKLSKEAENSKGKLENMVGVGSSNTQQSINNSSLILLLVGGAILLVGLVSFLVIKGTKKIKK